VLPCRACTGLTGEGFEMETGWIGEGPAESAPGGFAGFIAGIRSDPGDRPGPLQRALMVADRPDPVIDPDDRVADLMMRGYRPGSTLEDGLAAADLAGDLAAAQAELAVAERDLQRCAALRESGRIDPFTWSDASARAEDARGEVDRLRRRADGQEQARRAAAIAALPPRDRVPSDPAEAAVSRARHALGDHDLVLRDARTRTELAAQERDRRHAAIARAYR
jgi:hypothetical protein